MAEQHLPQPHRQEGTPGLYLYNTAQCSLIWLKDGAMAAPQPMEFTAAPRPATEPDTGSSNVEPAKGLTEVMEPVCSMAGRSGGPVYSSVLETASCPLGAAEPSTQSLLQLGDLWPMPSAPSHLCPTASLGIFFAETRKISVFCAVNNSVSLIWALLSFPSEGRELQRCS